MKLLPLLLLFLLGYFLSSGQTQNLVPNGDFEDHPEFPNGRSGDIFIDWFIPNDGTSDFYNRAWSFFGVPANIRGYQEAFSEDGYAGIFIGLEYIAVELSEPLEKGNIYQFNMMLNLSNESALATDAIGIRFLEEDPRLNSRIDTLSNSFRLSEGTFITDTLDWIPFEKQYNASGGERFLVIGQFLGGNTTTIETNASGTLPLPYYYIDDVSLSFTECFSDVIQLRTLDTLFCSERSLSLSGQEGANRYEWNNGSTDKNLGVSQTGLYEVISYDGCKEFRQSFDIRIEPCDCQLDLPSIQFVGDPLVVRKDADVFSYQIQLFNSSGQFITQFNEGNLGAVTLPSASTFYFWSAELLCRKGDDILTKKQTGGKFLVINP